jgi:FlaA1/EpsC-like NDP-sugar epimerase
MIATAEARSNGDVAEESQEVSADRLSELAGHVWRWAYRIASTNRGLSTTLVYGVLALGAYSTAFLLRFEFAIPADQIEAMARTVPLIIGLRLGASFIFRISTSRWRFVSTPDIRRLVAATMAASAALFALSWSVAWIPAVPRSVIIIDLLLFITLTAGVWLAYRTAFEQLRAFRKEYGEPSRVLIVGAGEAGSMLVRAMFRSAQRRLPVGFVDDDPRKLNAMLHGLPVIGSTQQLPALVVRHRIDEIVIAAPSARPSDLRRIVECCEATNLTFKMLPALSEVLEGNVHWSQVRPLRIEDLLGREPIALELPELYGDLHGRSVLITGAAGSIGSELARQVALYGPERLVLFDQSETGLFELGRELEQLHPGLELHLVVSDITDPIAVDQAFRLHRPSRVFHAAAYKHVSMMQLNVREAIRNNVLGTLYIGMAAAQYGAQKFVFVSTDKAVEPTSTMGATKRLAELLVIELQQRFPRTLFAAVRFGNVLGSNGSVIPIFRRQIECGGPLTITHPEATRYFMMIPEAVQLILQTSLLPEVRGRIAMLDMGEPVRIVDLARNLLRISGLPHRNGKMIVYTGLREGEKLHEELLAPGENAVPTRIEKVHVVVSSSEPGISVVRLLAHWQAAFQEGRHDEVIAELVELFPGLQRHNVEPLAQQSV